MKIFPLIFSLLMLSAPVAVQAEIVPPDELIKATVGEYWKSLTRKGLLKRQTIKNCLNLLMRKCCHILILSI